jgi:hypothetical protein
MGYNLNSNDADELIEYLDTVWEVLKDKMENDRWHTKYHGSWRERLISETERITKKILKHHQPSFKLEMKLYQNG